MSTVNRLQFGGDAGNGVSALKPPKLPKAERLKPGLSFAPGETPARLRRSPADYASPSGDRILPDFVFPPHQDPPFDRDQFLPTPPIPLEAHASRFPGDGDFPTDEDADPLGLADIDNEIAASVDSPDDAPFSEPLDPALEDQLHATEPENWISPVEKFAQENIPLLPPAEITGETLTPILWELMHNLALQGLYLSHTDHLSDRQLYAELWHHGLREPRTWTKPAWRLVS